MHSSRVPRHDRIDLLVRPPCAGHDRPRGWEALGLDPSAQIDEVTDLYARGFLSREGWERQGAKVGE